MLLREGAPSPLARALQQGQAPLGEVFAYISGTYFRGKLAYVRKFGGTSRVIAPGRGLLDPEVRISAEHVHAFGQVPVDLEDPAYTVPLLRDVRLLAEQVDGPVVLLGSVATGKYVEPLREILGDRLYFPLLFAGMGDMKRGALMLERSRTGEELAYGPVPVKC
jgi:hypothetical protein